MNVSGWRFFVILLSMACRVLCVILIVLASFNNVRAQDVADDISIGFMPATSLSYSGWHVILPVSVGYGLHKVYAGPKFNPPQSQLFKNMLWGINAGYQATYLRKNRWASFAALDYQSHAYTPGLIGSGKKNTVREIYFLLGGTYHFSEEHTTGLSLQFGAGMAIEGFYNQLDRKNDVSMHLAQMARLHFHYNFLKL